MKVILRNNAAGNLEVYVAKKDLEEEVVSQKIDGDIKVLTLTNGWELSI
ncbi:MAG: putative nitrogen fixation protein NifT, partial [Okeania sp. SIO1H6]|nr:putative nitrogen fixation protein NifT [Okeania sp. SIO1H6]